MPKDARICPKPALTSRRAFLAGTALCLSGTAAGASMDVADLRGSIDSADLGLIPNATNDQTAQFQNAVNRAVERGRALFLPAGTYPVANLRLPSGTLIVGVPGRTRLVYQGGGGQLIRAEGVSNIGLTGITFDGANRSIGDFTDGLLHFIGVRNLAIDECEVAGSTKSGLLLDRCSGRIENSRISGAAEAGIRSNEATGLSIIGNTVTDCANGGIWIHRWQDGEDGTIVSGNRVERISARYGGTGQFGNGINVFRAAGVVVSNNRVADCAFSAIRSNTGSNIQIIGNSCLRSGETAIYSEFGFQGAVIANNIADGGTIGISIANFADDGRLAVCSGNLIRNIKDTGPYPPDVAGFGIGIAAEADTTITGNVIEGVPKYGMLLGWGPYMRNIIASQNVLRDCNIGIAVSVADGVGPAVITNNIVQGAKQGSINGFRWLERATGELNGTSEFSNLTVHSNQIWS
ncbi:TIGR03808 family TAT-translocated repetitive protein [Labrenzia sp. R4_2]|uniref:TIGR03808 family TAT-translocated repetitive protein n=1 Tax=Labrenzia sp. R4_2 TaxID=2821107 RepID=UPI00336AB86B